MTPERVKTLIECYGADASAWPEEERADAQALYNASPELQALGQQEHTLDTILRDYDPMRYDEGMHLAERILTATPDRARHFSPWQRQGAVFALAAGVAAVAFVSFSLLRHTGEGTENVQAVAFNDWAWEETLDKTPAARELALNDPLVLLMPEMLGDNDQL